MISYFFKQWYGEFSREELKKYILLGITFAIIIGTYWALIPLKDSIFVALVIGYGKSGVSKEVYLAWAKVASLVFLFPLVVGYGKNRRHFSQTPYFYALGTFYVLALVGWAFFFASPTYGLANPIASPWRIDGWLWYAFVESFGSLFFALFWTFTTDITDAPIAKRAFPLVFLLRQLGGIIFPAIFPKPTLLQHNKLDRNFSLRRVYRSCRSHDPLFCFCHTIRTTHWLSRKKNHP
jgi:AAA family ATP:ADP antiporter